jgi:ABC-type phosphonate transport system ATPase subunit
VRISTGFRNVVIILAIAAVVAIVPGGGAASNTIVQALSLAFLAAIAWVASRLYREHRVALYSLGDRRRLILYTAVGVATLTFCATDRLWNKGGLGSVAWVLLIAIAAFAVFEVFRSAREY